MNHNGNGTHEVNIDKRTPIDDIEPLANTADDLREAAIKYVSVLNGFARRIESGLREGTWQAAATAFWSAAYGLGLNCCEGMSMTERASSLGVQRATISKGARTFVAANNLEPSYFMKDEKAFNSYSRARLNVVIHSNGHNFAGPSHA